MALKRTEIKRSRIEHKNKKNLIKKAKRDTRLWELLAIPKINKITKTQQQRRDGRTREYRLACMEVDKRDKHTCQFPGCKSKITQHHHGTYRSHGGRDRVEELVSLCYHHHQGDISPHQSEEWRKYWVKWLEDKYSEYWISRKSQEITPRWKEGGVCSNG